MKLSRRAALAALAFAWISPAMAQGDYPNKPIRIIVPSVAGGGLDLTTRLVAEKMSEFLGQPIVIDNRPGADAVLGVRVAKDADPDGYTLVTHSGQLVLTPLMKSGTGYDPMVDFVGVGRMIAYPMVMQVAVEKAEKTVSDLVAHAKAEPGQLSFGSSGIGSPAHMAAGMFFHQQGLELTHVPYKGSAQALPDVAAGRTYVMTDGYNSSQSYLNGGKTKPLGVTGDQRIKPMPDVPTFKEQGYDYTYYLWLGMFAPANTPKEIVDRLSEALHTALNSPDLKERFISEGSTPIIETPTEFAAALKKEHDQMAQVVKDLNLSQ